MGGKGLREMQPFAPLSLVSSAVVILCCGAFYVRCFGCMAQQADVEEITLNPLPKMINNSARMQAPPNANGCQGVQCRFYESVSLKSKRNRLGEFDTTTVQTANDWHFAMMNDRGRNRAFQSAIQRAVRSSDSVLEIGTGSGLLAMIAARVLNKGHVYTIEANPDFAMLATKIIKQNHLDKKITVIRKMSTETNATDLGATEEGGNFQKADVLIAETIGTSILGEGQLEYIQDVRERLCTPEVRLIPGGAHQHITLFESTQWDELTRVTEWDGLDLTAFNQLRHTSSFKFSKTWGLDMADIKFREMTPPIKILDLNFYTASYDQMPSRRVFKVPVLHDGVVHGSFAHFELFEDGACQMPMLSTHPSQSNFIRGRSWGVFINVVGEERAGGRPIPVLKGQMLTVTVRYRKQFFYVDVTILPYKDNNISGKCNLTVNSSTQ